MAGPRDARSWSLAFALAFALPLSARAAPTAGGCAEASWRLDGAATASDDDASFSRAWVPLLGEVLDCLKDEALDRACVTVQGRYDDTEFSGAVSKALGSQAAAQTMRARGRAQRVMAWFHEAGVAPYRLVERPPPTQASWRGVHVALLADCLPATPAPVVVTAQTDDEQIRVVVRETLAERGPPPAAAAHAITVELPPPAPAAAGPWWLSASTGVGALFADGVDDVAASITRVGFGWTGDHSYARLDGGLSVGSETGQARGWETGLGLGWHALPWLDLGLRAGHRISAADFTEPWADQAFFGGVESAQCLSLTGDLDLCLDEFVGGGLWTQRAVEVGPSFYFVPEEDRAALIIGLNVGLRQGL